MHKNKGKKKKGKLRWKKKKSGNMLRLNNEQ